MLSIHLLGVLESCNCDYESIYISTDSVAIRAFSNRRYPKEGEPIDRSALGLEVQLISNASELYYQSYHAGILSSAEASRGECLDENYSVIKEHIKKMDIFLQFDNNGNEINQLITDDFLVDGGDRGLYQEIGLALSNHSIQYLFLVYKEEPQGDSLGLIIKTYLSDDRIFSDTVNIQLK